MAKSRELMVEYIPQFRTTPFVVRLGEIEELLSVRAFQQFYADCEEAMQSYEAEKVAVRLDLKRRYEAARKGERKV